MSVMPLATRPLSGSPIVAAIVLAAGRGLRMGAASKPLLELGGRPILRSVVAAALASRAAQTIVVTGHEASRVREALDGLPVRVVNNPVHPQGLSTSVRAGLSARAPESDAAVFLLADMPLIRAQHIDALIEAYSRGGADICLPVHNGRRGNPVLWGCELFEELAALDGDQGGRALLEKHAARVHRVEMDKAVLVDLDEPADLLRLTGQGRAD